MLSILSCGDKIHDVQLWSKLGNFKEAIFKVADEIYDVVTQEAISKKQYSR